MDIFWGFFIFYINNQNILDSWSVKTLFPRHFLDPMMNAWTNEIIGSWTDNWLIVAASTQWDRTVCYKEEADLDCQSAALALTDANSVYRPTMYTHIHKIRKTNTHCYILQYDMRKKRFLNRD